MFQLVNRKFYTMHKNTIFNHRRNFLTGNNSTRAKSIFNTIVQYIDTIFGYSGRAIMPLINEYKSGDISYVDLYINIELPSKSKLGKYILIFYILSLSL